MVEVAISLEGRAEVLLEDAGGDDLLALLALWACLSVVLAEVWVVGGDEADDALLSLVAHVDAHKHGLGRDVSAEVHSPEVTSEFGIDLSYDVQVDAVVVSVDGLARHELRDDGVVIVDLVLHGGVEELLALGVRNDDKEELDGGLGGVHRFGGRASLLLASTALSVVDLHVVLEVGVDRILEVIDARLVVQRDDVSIVNEDVEPVGLREGVELVLEVLAVFDVLLQAENCPLLEVYWLANDLPQNAGVVQGLGLHRVHVRGLLLLLLGGAHHGHVLHLLLAGDLLGGRWGGQALDGERLGLERLRSGVHHDAGALEDLGFDLVWLKVDL